ncbi:hypothetical protein [Legionella norrlandica]|nr:hypothetical protein [Legionella norrlandica]
MFKNLCERIKKKYQNNIVFVAFDCTDKQVKQIRDAAHQLEIQFELQSSHFNEFKDISSAKSLPPMGLLDKFYYRMKSESYKNATCELEKKKEIYIKDIKSNLTAAQYLIEKYNPKLILVGEDGISGNVFLIKQAKQNKIPVINIPYEVSGREDFINLIHEKIEKETVIKFNSRDSRYHEFIKKKFKHWILTTEYFDTILFPPELIIARLEYGIDLPNPWTTHGGNADLLAVESHAMLEHYIKENLNKAKLKLVGTVYCDVMYDSMNSDPIYKASYLNKTKISDKVTSILVSLPPSYHNTRKFKNEFPTYKDMIYNLFNMLRELGPNMEITVSVHPAISFDELEIIKSFDVTISNDWIIDLIPKHDIFFVFSYSSSIRWAIACGKPIINYDTYDHNLKIYAGVQGFFNYKYLKDVWQKLTDLQKKEEYEKIASQMASIRDNWGNLDGKNVNRICNLFDILINREI